METPRNPGRAAHMPSWQAFLGTLIVLASPMGEVDELLEIAIGHPVASTRMAA